MFNKDYHEEENGFFMKYEADKKVFHIKVEGMFNPTIGDLFLKYYSEGVKTFNPKETNFIIESQDLIISVSGMLETMENCYKLYNSSNFKEKIVVTPKSPLAKRQAISVANNAGFNGKFVTSLDEAYKLL